VKKIFKFVALSMACIMLLGLVGCSGADKTKFRVGMECNYAPYNWTQEDDSNGAVAIEGGGYAGGYDVEIAKKIATALGRELVIYKIEWSNLEQQCDAGKIDAIIAGMSPLIDRQQKLAFTNKYYTAVPTVVVRKDSTFAAATTTKDFAGAKITSQKNTLHLTMISQLEGADKQAGMIDYPSLIAAVLDKTVDGYVCDIAAAKAAVFANPDLTYITFADGEGFEIEESAIAVNVGLKTRNNFSEDINAVLATISDEERETMMDTAIANQPMNAQ